ncbi:MAG TPA: glycosyltransferase family 39 protein [Saprospiraceae bacterium]|nr:glycosyltransferase family 39 protein [Saprospiraceae bacterium]HMQ83861.1 glycosyltransferase family 39 protein [Saprospiraceae bacterium]
MAKTVLILSLSILLAILLVNPQGDFPLNDDWQYAYPVKQLLETGQMSFQGYFSPNIVAQVGWGYLFCLIFGGFSFTFLRYSTLAAALVGVFLFCATARHVGLKDAPIRLGGWLLLFNPLFFSLAFSFMSDVPFLALMLASTYCFGRYFSKKDALSFSIAVLCCLLAFLVRQPGIVLLPALGAWLLWEKGINGRTVAKAFGLVLLAALVYWLFEKWGKPWLGIEKNFVPVTQIYLDQIVNSPGHFLLELAKKALKTWIYMGFFGLPLIPFLWHLVPKNGFSLQKCLIVLAVNGVLLLALHLGEKIFPFGGNILFNFGLGPELLADVYSFGVKNTPQLPAGIFYGLNFISQLSATLLTYILWKQSYEYSPQLRTFLRFLLLANLLYLPLMSITAFFDRYLLFPLAGVFLALLPGVRIQGHPFKWGILAALSLFSLLATKDYLSWNRARQQAFRYLEEQGISIRQMDAGYEYNGWYNYHPNPIKNEDRSYWWVSDDTWKITFGTLPGHQVLHTVPYRRWLWGGQQDAILVLQQIEQ